MTIIVKAPLKSQDIQNLLDGYEKDGIAYKFLTKTAVGMEFEATSDNAEKAVAAAKDYIKSTDFGKVLYFSVVVK